MKKGLDLVWKMFVEEFNINVIKKNKKIIKTVILPLFYFKNN